MKRKSFFVSLSLILLLSIGIIVADYFDVFSKIEFFGHINLDILALIINNAIIVILFIVTYHLIDSHNMESNKRNMKILDNKRSVGLHYIKKTASNCEEMVKILTPDVVKNIIVPKVDFNAPGDAGVTKNIKNSPFVFEEQLYNLFTDGSLYKEELDLYLELKNNYQIYIGAIITFFDAPNLYTPPKQNYVQTIKKISQMNENDTYDQL